MRRRAVITGLLASGAAGTIAPARAEAPGLIAFDGLYKSYGVRGLVFSDAVVALAGQPVRMTGYMAPPLKAESRFFVLTRQPLALCPFCQSDADWPVDIVVVYLRRAAPLVDAGTRIAILGRLETGSWTDPESGFVSQLRVMDATFGKG